MFWTINKHFNSLIIKMKVLDSFKTWDKANSLKTQSYCLFIIHNTLYIYIYTDWYIKYWKLKPVSFTIIWKIWKEQNQLSFNIQGTYTKKVTVWR